MHIINQIHPYVRRAFFSVFIITALLIICRLYLHFYVKPTAASLHYSLLTRANFDSFLISWSVNFAFFLIIGIATYWTTIRNPKNDPLESRFLYFLNSPVLDLHPTLRDFKKKEFLRAASFTEKCDFRIVIKEYDPVLRSLEVEVSETRIIKNLLEDYEYYDERVRCLVEADDVGVGSETVGEVFLLRTTCNGENNNIIQEVVKIKRGTPRFECFYPIAVPKNGEICCETRYWIMQKADGDFWVTCDRYTQRASITVCNRIDGDSIDIRIISAPEDQRCITIGKSECGEMVYDGQMQPLQRLFITFDIPK